MLLLLLLPACVGYFIYAARLALKIRKSRALGAEDTRALGGNFVLAGSVPAVVAVIMSYLFLIQGTATTVQLNSSAGVGRWSLWVDLFPALLLFTASSGIANLVWAIRCALTARLRNMIIIPASASLLSVLAFFTVASFFPSA